MATGPDGKTYTQAELMSLVCWLAQIHGTTIEQEVEKADKNGTTPQEFLDFCFGEKRN